MDNGSHSCLLNETLDFTNTDISRPPFIFYLSGEWFLYQIAWPAIIIFGFMTNISFLITVYRDSSFHTATYVYLVNLSCADLIALLSIGLVDGVIMYHLNTPIRGVVSINVCSGIGFVTTMSFGASLFFVTLMSLERFLAICYPIKHHLMKGNHRNVKFILATWIASIITAGSAISVYHNDLVLCILLPEKDPVHRLIPRKAHLCSSPETRSSWIYLISVCYITLWAFLAIGNGSMYASIMRALNRRQQNMSHCSSADTEAQLRQVAIMLIANGSIFFLCCAIQMSNVTLLIISILNPELYPWNDYQRQVYLDFVRFSMGVNCSINPLVYAMTNARYRKAFCKTFRPLCCVRVPWVTICRKAKPTRQLELSRIQ